MRQGFSALRHEPVGCVVTIVAGDHGAVHVLEVASNGTGVVRRVGDRAEHFSDVHGSLVFIGDLPAVATDIHAAVIYDLPDGRIRTGGTARVTCTADGSTRVTVESTLADGSIRLDAVCPGPTIAELQPQTRHGGR